MPSGKDEALRGGLAPRRSARNLSYQDKLPVEGHAEELLQIKGQDLMGVPLKVCTQLTCCTCSGVN